MIGKFRVIKGIGRFYNYSARSDGLGFKKNTLIFAQNAYGKSTITSILKSLSLNEPSLMLERKTIGKDLKQHVVIDYQGGQFVFENDIWTLNKIDSPPIYYFFDQEYIHENIFVFDVSTEHKKRIHEIVVGQEGIRLSKDLTSLKEKESAVKSISKEFSLQLTNKQEITGCEDYLNLPDNKQSEIQQEIESIKKRIIAKKSIDKILEMQTLSHLTEISLLDIVHLEHTLKRTPQTINLKSKEIVLNHFKVNLRTPDNCANFIQEGIRQIQSDNCPFCGQKISLNASKLLDAYSSYFDYSYAELQGEVAALYDMLRSRSFETEFTDIKLKLAEHEKVSALWAPFLGDKFSRFTVKIDIESSAQRLHNLQVDLLNQIDKKIKNVKLVPDIDSAKKIIIIINEINSSIRELNLLCDEKNKAIEQYKNAIINDGDLSSLEQKLNQAENQLNRFTPKEKAWCKQYSDVKKDEEKAVSEYEDKKKELSEYSKNIFKKYEKEMNNVLTLIGTNFRIGSFQGVSDRRTKSAFADFHISINNHPVGIGRSNQPIPCFSNTLSAGDKNALAFAFFVAGLKVNNYLEKAIIVLDDPLNSLDDFRRSRTSQIIKELSDKPEQVIILTHKRDFLYMLDDSLRNPGALSIKTDSVNGSTLIPFDIAEDRKLDHHKRIDRLRVYLSDDSGPGANEIQQDIRIVLETALKFKYYNDLTEISTLGSMLDVLAPLGKLDPDVLSQCRNLNNISSPSHHGESIQQQPLQQMERDELLPYVSETIEVLEKL